MHKKNPFFLFCPKIRRLAPSGKGVQMAVTEPFKLKDIAYGLVIPVLVGILILLFPTVFKDGLDRLFSAANPAANPPVSASPYAFLTVILTHGISLVAMFAIPLIFGLTWNKWAGGAIGFITGTLYYLAFAGYNIMYAYEHFGVYYMLNLYRDPAFIGDYIVCGMLVGYIAGALNNKSSNFKRMLGASYTAAIIVGMIQFVLNMTVSLVSDRAQADPFQTWYQALLPMLILGFISPVIAKVMTWYGITPTGHS